MFAADHWARAFTRLLDKGGIEALERGLELLKALSAGLAKAPGHFAGTSASTRLYQMIHSILEPSAEGEMVCRFLTLLVRKGQYPHIGAVIRAIEKRLDEKKGILPVRLDTAFPPEGDYEERLKELLKKRTGAREIRLEKRILPELLGGCRLQIGSEFLDTTLRARLQQMTDDLAAFEAAAGARALGGV